MSVPATESETAEWRDGGFTLVEILVAVLLAGFFASAGALLLVSASDVAERSVATEKLLFDGRRAIERMRRDAHRLRGGTAQDLLDLEPARFRFVDRDGATVTWELVGATLRRNGIDALDGVQSLAFSYRRPSGAGAATHSNLGRVDVTLTVAEGAFTEVLSESIVPRCFAPPFTAFGGS